jgi:hypothetical protein
MVGVTRFAQRGSGATPAATLAARRKRKSGDERAAPRPECHVAWEAQAIQAVVGGRGTLSAPTTARSTT